MPAPNVNMSQRPQGRRLALVIGVNEAPGALVPALGYAESDAQAIAEVLEYHGNYTLFEPPLLGAQATSHAIKRMVLRLLRECTKDDVLLFYFSGHGKLLLIEQADQPGFDQAYLVTHDFSENEVEDDPTLHLSLRWLRDQMFNRSQAAQVLLILDCCYSGELGRAGPNPQVQELLQHIADYFKLPATTQSARSGGLRLALTATGHLQTVPEQGGHGIMSGSLLRALRGEVDDVLGADGAITFTRLLDYLFTEMPPGNKPSYLGDSAAQNYILAWHPERADVLRRLRAHVEVAERPMTYIPFPRNRLFQQRPGEFTRLEALLSGEVAQRDPVHMGLVGATGMGGVGKTQLAVELAYRCLDAQRFADGIFWTVARGKTAADWQWHLAELAFNANYLPPGDDPTRSDNERQRAMHLCRYLAAHQDALLILDNVDAPKLINTALPALAGGELACAVLYTSRITTKPRGVELHNVDVLSEDGALRLLLEMSRPAVLETIQMEEANNVEAEAARKICQRVGLLPLALVHLRGLLERDPYLTLTRLEQVLMERGVLALATAQHEDAAPLFATFALSREQVRDAAAGDLFALACYFPEAIPIPLWLLGLAAGLGEEGDIIDPLGQARLHLQELSLLEVLSSDLVRLHPLVREFGRALAVSHPEQEAILRAAALRRLVVCCADLHALESRARCVGFWICLEQVRALYAFAMRLSGEAPEIERVERWLDRESYLLSNGKLWPEVLPGLFYQQLFNHAVEEGVPFAAPPPPTCWLRQELPVLAEDRSLLRIFAGHVGPVTSVAFSSDGSLILTGSYDKTARVWESTSGRLIQTIGNQLPAPYDDGDGVTSLAFSPDGKLVLIGFYHDRTAQLWEWENGQLVHTFQGHNDGVNSVEFSPDGNLVLTGSADGTARLWELTSGRLVHIFKHTYKDPLGNKERTGHIGSVAFSPNGNLILTHSILGYGSTHLWERASGRLIRTFEGHADSVAFSPDGSLILLGTHLWEQASGRLIRTFEGDVGSVAFSPDGSLILTGSRSFDHAARLWERASGRLVHTFEGHTSNITSVAFSPDGNLILTGSVDDTARLWKRTDNAFLDTFEQHHNWGNQVAFSPDGRLVLASYDNIARLWEWKGGRLVRTFEGHSSKIESVAFSPDGSLILTSSWDHTTRLWDLASGQLLHTFEGNVRSVAFSPDGNLILTGSHDHTARLWDLVSGQLLHKYNFEGHSNSLRKVLFCPDGSQVLIVNSYNDDENGIFDNTAWLWDLVSGQLLHKYNFEGHTSDIVSVAFSPDGSLLLTGSHDHTVRLWEWVSGQLLYTFTYHNREVDCVAFSPDGRIVVSCDLGGQVLFWQNKGEHQQGTILGFYATSYPIKAIYWPETKHMLLADTLGCPHIHQLCLEGTW